ncbi:hypothetical protein MLD38_015076 [Melastoma candidum]|uniref:Uncharacterized protein n=1 Tax=Melastoma candidum TaxID=119954 RepID=A0ACB9REX4_9MYRT|nr:hypothetical protein MLD38_015076 [Melastoma candidum]
MAEAGDIAGNLNEQKGSLRNVVEMVKSVSDKHLDLLRPSARYYTGSKDASERERGRYTLIKDADDGQFGMYDKPLPCFGCGIGWFSFLVGIICPPMWYYATVLYFGNFYRKDPRERAGLAASAIAAMISTVLLLVIGGVLIFTK